MSISQQKKGLRNHLQTKRKALSAFEQQQKSLSIAKTIANSVIFKTSRKIAIYHAVGGEANPESLRSYHSKEFYLPVLPNDKDLGLLFAPVTNTTQYKNNVFSIPEPICLNHEYIQPQALDLVVMPLLGFDLIGNRLGMGGGYYDRCFAFKKEQPKRPILLGYAYDFQEVNKISEEPWDIGFDIIATETRFIEI